MYCVHNASQPKPDFGISAETPTACMHLCCPQTVITWLCLFKCYHQRARFGGSYSVWLHITKDFFGCLVYESVIA